VYLQLGSNLSGLVSLFKLFFQYCQCPFYNFPSRFSPSVTITFAYHGHADVQYKMLSISFHGKKFLTATSQSLQVQSVYILQLRIYTITFSFQGNEFESNPIGFQICLPH